MEMKRDWTIEDVLKNNTEMALIRATFTCADQESHTAADHIHPWGFEDDWAPIRALLTMAGLSLPPAPGRKKLHQPSKGEFELTERYLAEYGLKV